jgi:hypothetical protein
MKTTINLDVKRSVMNNTVKESMPAVARADSGYFSKRAIRTADLSCPKGRMSLWAVYRPFPAFVDVSCLYTPWHEITPALTRIRNNNGISLGDLLQNLLL